MFKNATKKIDTVQSNEDYKTTKLTNAIMLHTII
jgi:hypothetical protein